MRLTPFFKQEMQKAFEEGIEQGTINSIFRLLTRKFGEIPINLRDKIHQLSVEELENLVDAFLDFNEVSDLENWLN